MATIKVHVKTLFMKQINCDFTHARMHTHRAYISTDINVQTLQILFYLCF